MSQAEAHQIKNKFFINKFLDFSVDNARDLLQGYQIKPNSKLCTNLEEKWTSTIKKIKRNLNSGDSSVYTGTAGIALLYMLKDPHDLTNLKNITLLLKTNQERSKRRPTFLCGDGGPLSIGAVAFHRMGDDENCMRLIKSLLSLKETVLNTKSNFSNEYMYGRAGYLYSLLYINKYIKPAPIEDSDIREVIEAILKAGQKTSKMLNSSKCPLMFQWHDTYYLGAAHGITGIIYLLLQSKQYLKESELNDLIRPTIDFLVTLQFPSGNYPSSLETQSGDKYVQWCHGAPGFVYMYSIAYKVFQDPHYLELAISAADVVWDRGLLHKGFSICHGVSGNAYCFLELYQTTKNIKYLYRAAKFAEWCMDNKREHEHHPPDRPISLYEGICGPMYLLLDIQKPLEAKLPGFTL